MASPNTAKDKCWDMVTEVTDIKEYLKCSKLQFEKRLNDNLDNIKQCHVSDFVLLKTIGIGAFCRVLLVHHKSDDTKFLAMKVIKKEHILRKNHLRYVNDEIRFLAAIRHPFITNLTYVTKDACNLYIMTPFAVGGDLFQMIQTSRQLDEQKTRFYSGQIVLALEYLHALDIIYRDLKPENILIDEKGYIKLADLGMCKRVAKQTTTMCGTLQYMAPEIISVKAYGQSVDWWALGVIVYEMMSGNTPFNAANDKRLIYNILNCEYNIPVSFSPDLSDLVKNLLQNNLTKRYGNLSGGVDDIKRHRWFNKIDWTKLFHKQVDVPFVPIYNGLSDTRYFDQYVDEKFDTVCNIIDQSYFENI